MYGHVLKLNPVSAISNTYDSVNQLWFLLGIIEAVLNENVVICLIGKIALAEDFTKMMQWRKLTIEATC